MNHMNYLSNRVPVIYECARGLARGMQSLAVAKDYEKRRMQPAAGVFVVYVEKEKLYR